MKITIHRGLNQIGGCITEIQPLSGTKMPAAPHILCNKRKNLLHLQPFRPAADGAGLLK